MSRSNRFLERLSQGPVICGEGYVFELERRGYLQAGSFVPEVVVEHPDVVAQLHREFCRAGSDVVECLTYYAHREKLRLVGKEDMVEMLNKQAIRIAKEVAKEFDALVAGNISNTNLWHEGMADEAATEDIRSMFEEQVNLAASEGVDFIIGETFAWLGEALLALDVIKKTGLPAVITLALVKSGTTRDGFEVEDAMRQLEANGATVVGLNCHLGPWTMLPIIERAVKAVKIPVAALPVPYRTHAKEPTFMQLTDPQCCVPVLNDRPFPVALDSVACNRFEIAEFAFRAKAVGVKYFGLCCGAGPHHLRSLAEALGRVTPASKYSPDMTKHFAFGNHSALKQVNLTAKNDL